MVCVVALLTHGYTVAAESQRASTFADAQTVASSERVEQPKS